MVISQQSFFIYLALFSIASALDITKSFGLVGREQVPLGVRSISTQIGNNHCHQLVIVFTFFDRLVVFTAF